METRGNGSLGVSEAAEVLAAGGIVCFPTESSYGLAARLDRPAACERIAALKERDSDSPFPVIAPNIEAAVALASPWPAAAAALADKYWPGPLTLVIAARSDLPKAVVGPSGGVGVRVSPHPIAAQLAALAGPITATSANRRGRPPAITLDEARAAFVGEDLAYLDGGECAGGAPSTVAAVSFDGDVTVLRAGAIEMV